MNPVFFETPDAWRDWLEHYHTHPAALWVGFFKKDSGHPSITWPESVDEALCFGWIDGVRKRLDEKSYAIRFTPRKKDSIWSAVNIQRFAELQARGRVWPMGLAAFEARSEERSRLYSYERSEPAVLPPEFERRLRADEKAWAFFQAQSPSYQRTSLHWIMTAKKEETRLKRLTTLLEDSARGQTLKHLTPRHKLPARAAE